MFPIPYGWPKRPTLVSGAPGIDLCGVCLADLHFKPLGTQNPLSLFFLIYTRVRVDAWGCAVQPAQPLQVNTETCPNLTWLGNVSSQLSRHVSSSVPPAAPGLPLHLLFTFGYLSKLQVCSDKHHGDEMNPWDIGEPVSNCVRGWSVCTVGQRSNCCLG